MRPSALDSAAESGNNYARAAPETDLASTTFDAKQYLAVTHATTSFSSLQTELKELKRTTSDKTEQLKALVSAHFDQYLSCHEAVRALSDDIKTHQKDNELFLSDMKTLKQVTDSTLSVMLQRAKEQRRIRNTIAVLHRFRPIFEITTKMKESLHNKDFDKLAEDYCRLKLHQNKANIAALQPVLASAHEIAKRANTELLKHFDDVSLSVKDQKRAITVLEAIGLTEKPTLTCLLKQFSFLEAKLAVLQQSDSCDPTNVVYGSAAVINRFRSGLWGFICDVFTPVAAGGSNSAMSQAITSAEAESIQQKAWAILSKSVELIERNASPPTAQVLKQLNESFREISSLKKCTNTTLLNTNIAQLKSSFCDKFRIKIVLQFVQQTCTTHREQLLSEYFDPATSIQSLATDVSFNVAALASDTTPLGGSSSSVQGRKATKVARLISEASSAFDEVRTTSMVSSESKVRLSRASVLTACCGDVMQRWSYIWKHVGGVLLTMAEGVDTAAPGATATDSGIDAKIFRSLLVKEMTHQLQVMLSSLFNQLLENFASAVAPPTTMASVAGSLRNRDGPGVCIVFAIVANCIELREKHLSTVDQWIRQLGDERPMSASVTNSASTPTAPSHELCQLLLEIEAKCVDKYVAMHAVPLLRILRAGSAEEAQQSRALLPAASRAGSTSGSASTSGSGAASGSGSRTESLRIESRTASSSSFDFGTPPTPSAIASAASVQNSIPQDSRQYVFNVLLQLITLRSEVETSLSHYAQCHTYVRTVSVQLTAKLSSYLHEAVTELEKAEEPSEWRRIHLLVEVRFFQFTLRDHLSEESKIQLVTLEKSLEKTKPSEKVALAQIQLLAQLKHQTKLYLLALQQG